jgi:hypothetical protein
MKLWKICAYMEVLLKRNTRREAKASRKIYRNFGCFTKRKRR